MSLERSLLWADRIFFGAGGLAAIATVITLLASVAQYRLNTKISKQKDREFAEFRVSAESRIAEAQKEGKLASQAAAQANERAVSLAVDLEKARAETARADSNLLAEQRLTARERMRLISLEKAVFPRSLLPKQYNSLLLKLIGLGPVNVAIVDKREPRNLGMQLVQLFQAAGIMGRMIWLPHDSDQGGVTTYAANEHGRRVAEILWTEGIGGSTLGGGVRPIGLEAIPKDENTLIVGDNDAAFQPMPGQPGEGLDEHGRPVPAPQ